MATRRALNTQTDLARALASIYRAVDSNKMPESRARVLIYAVVSLSAVLKDSDLEARICALEERLAAKATRRAA